MFRRRLTNNFGVNANSCVTWRLQANTVSNLLFSSVPAFDSIATTNGRHSSDRSGSMTNFNSSSIMFTSRRTYYSRQLNTNVTLQRKDGKTYPALLSWNWNTERPRHLVVKIAEPASTLRNTAISNKNNSSESIVQKNENVESSVDEANDNENMSKENSTNGTLTSQSEENSPSTPLSTCSMTTDAQSANSENDDPYFFGRLFLRVHNVAELLSVLIGWSPSAQIERERAGLMLRPTSFASQESNGNGNGKTGSAKGKEKGYDKNDMVVENIRKEESKQALSNFTLTGYFTKKMKVHEVNEKLTEQEQVAKHGNYAMHGRDENEEQAVYIDNELCTISVTLQASELMLLKNFLDNTMSNIFGIEHCYYRKIIEQVMEKQRRHFARQNYSNNNNGREVTTNYPPRYRSEMLDHSPYNRSTSTQQNLQMASSVQRKYYPQELHQHQQQQEEEEKEQQYLYEEQQMRRRGGRGGSSHYYNALAQVKEDYTRPFIINDKSSNVMANDKLNMENKNDDDNNDNHNALKEKLANVQQTQVVTSATTDLKSELSNEENEDNVDHEMQADEIDDSKSIEAEINDICDEEYEEIDEQQDDINSEDDDDDANNDNQINNSNNVESNATRANDDSAHRMKSNCETIADEESVRDTDELDAEEVDADEEIAAAKCAKVNQEETAIDARVPVSTTEGKETTTLNLADNADDDHQVNENEWEVSEEYEEVIDDDVAANAADKNQGEQEEEEIVEEVEEDEEEETNMVDQTEVDKHNKEISEGAKDETDANDTLDGVGEQNTKEKAIDSPRSEEVVDEQKWAEGEQVHQERNAEAGNTTQSAEEQSDMEVEEIEEIVEEEIEEVEDELDDDEHVKTLATDETGNVTAEMNANTQVSKSDNTAQTDTNFVKKTTHDDSAVEDVKIGADGSNVCATGTSLPNRQTKIASMDVQTNKHKTLEHATQSGESDKSEPVMQVKANAARTLATKVANIREQGANEVSADKDVSDNFEQSTKPEVYHTDEKPMSDGNKLIRKSGKVAGKSSKAHAVAPSSTKRFAKKHAHTSHTKKSSKKSKKQSKSNRRIVVEGVM